MREEATATNIPLLGLGLAGIACVAATALETPFRGIVGLIPSFVVLPLLSAALLAERKSTWSLAIGGMLAILVTMAIGLLASMVSTEDRPAVSRIALACSIGLIAVVSGRLRRGGWKTPQMAAFRWPRGVDVLIVVAGATALTLSIVGAVSTRDAAPPYVEMSVLAPDGTMLDGVIAGTAGSSTSIAIEVENNTPEVLEAVLRTAAGADVSVESIEVSPGAKVRVPITLVFEPGVSSVTLTLDTGTAALNRLIILRLQGN